jgi:hypothetical protein
MDGWFPPNKNRPLPLSHTDSIFDRDENRTFSASAAACGSRGRPRTGANVVFLTYSAEEEV